MNCSMRRTLCIVLSASLSLANLPTEVFAQGQAAGGGLSWSRTIDIKDYKPGEPFRFSLCENRFLKPGEVSKPCQKGNSKIVSGGHNADYTFGTSLTTLPPGLRLDAFGVLSGTGEVDLPSALPKIYVCVRQLNEAQNCAGLGSFAGIQPSQQVAGAPPAAQTSSGSGVGAALLVGGLVAGATALAAAAAGGGGGGSSSSNGGSSSSCSATFSQCCSRAGSGYCGISPSIQPTSCGCPAPARSGGICNAGAACNTSGGISAGSLICNC